MTIKSTRPRADRPRLAKGLLDVEAAAKRMGVGKDAIYIGIHSGIIPHIRLGNRFIIPEPAFERLLTEGAQAPNTDRDKQST